METKEDEDISMLDVEEAMGNDRGISSKREYIIHRLHEMRRTSGRQ